MGLYYAVVLRNYITESHYGYHGRYRTEDILWQVYYGRYIAADTFRQIYCGRYITPYIYIYIYIYIASTKTAISRQMHIAGSCRLLHPNPFVATHHSKDSSGLCILSTLRTGPFLVGHMAEPGETQGFRRRRTHHGERSLVIGPQGRALLYILYIYVNNQTYTYTYA